MNHKPMTLPEMEASLVEVGKQLVAAEEAEISAFAKANGPHGGGAHPRAEHFMALSFLAATKCAYENLGRKIDAEKKRIKDEAEKAASAPPAPVVVPPAPSAEAPVAPPAAT